MTGHPPLAGRCGYCREHACSGEAAPRLPPRTQLRGHPGRGPVQDLPRALTAAPSESPSCVPGQPGVPEAWFRHTAWGLTGAPRATFLLLHQAWGVLLGTRMHPSWRVALLRGAPPHQSVCPDVDHLHKTVLVSSTKPDGGNGRILHQDTKALPLQQMSLLNNVSFRLRGLKIFFFLGIVMYCPFPCTGVFRKRL